MRDAFDDKSVDVVSVVTPNHWHGLSGVWALQAGVDIKTPLMTMSPVLKFDHEQELFLDSPEANAMLARDDRDGSVCPAADRRYHPHPMGLRHFEAAARKTFFLALGLYAPHFPNYAPQKFFDMYPLESIQRPAWKADDLDDLSEPVRKKYSARKKAIHDKLLDLGIVDSTLQAYLASISYADSLLGRVLDTLEDSSHADNTIIVFWSDHGYGYGEKGNWGKHTLWQRTSNIPFLWAGPGIAKKYKD